MSRLHRPRVVFDTAVVLRALLFNDAKSKQLRSAWQTGQCQALIAKSSAQALMKALAFPAFELDEAQQLELLADFLPYAEVVDGQVLAGLGSTLDHLVSDCPKLRKGLVPCAMDLKQGALRRLGSEEFLAGL